MLYNAILFAQEAPTQPAAGSGPGAGGATDPFGGLMGMLPIILIMLGFFWFFILRPARQQDSERKKLIASLKKGDEVLVHPGIYGTIISISETEDEAVVKVDEGTRMKVLKSCIIRNLSGEKAAKEEKDKK